jgi:hypothetical protein
MSICFSGDEWAPEQESGSMIFSREKYAPEPESKSLLFSGDEWETPREDVAAGPQTVAARTVLGRDVHEVSEEDLDVIALMFEPEKTP